MSALRVPLHRQWPLAHFTSGSLHGHPDAFAVGMRTGGAPAPKNAAVNVDWLSLKAIEGKLADEIFGVETRGGQPPTSVRLLNFVLIQYSFE